MLDIDRTATEQRPDLRHFIRKNKMPASARLTQALVAHAKACSASIRAAIRTILVAYLRRPSFSISER